MNSLSVNKVHYLSLIYQTLAALQTENEEWWNSASAQEVFDAAMKRIGKRVNPSMLQIEIDRLNQFSLPRNVQDQHNDH